MKTELAESSEFYSPEKLLEATKVSKLVWEANKRSGVQVELRNDRWWGYSKKGGNIEIGTQPVPNEIKKSWGLDEGMLDEACKQYIFSHENMHYVLWEAFNHPEEYPELRNLLNSLRAIREHTGRGLSRLGNTDVYNKQNRDTAHEEDVTELFNMYGISPQNLKDYLTYLVRTDDAILKDAGLYKLVSQEVGDNIFKAVSIIIAKFLKQKGIVDGIKQ